MTKMNLDDYLNQFDEEQTEAYGRIPLFKSPALTKVQQKYFAKVFYHLRAHFNDFVWYMANFAPDKVSKEVIMDNIQEEFGGSGKSHEALYFDFARALGVELADELLSQPNYLDFARDFNRGHRQFLAEHDWETRVAAFCAYERLDNIDYNFLKKLVSGFGLSDDALRFFTVHTGVEHYGAAKKGLGLENIWQRNPEKVKEGFSFIGSHQAQMLRDLSDAVLDYAE